MKSIKSFIWLLLLVAFTSASFSYVGTTKVIFTPTDNVTFAADVITSNATNVSINVYLSNYSNVSLVHSANVTTDVNGYVTYGMGTLPANDNTQNSRYYVEFTENTSGTPVTSRVYFKVLPYRSILTTLVGGSLRLTIGSQESFIVRFMFYNASGSIANENMSFYILPSTGGVALNTTWSVTDSSGNTGNILVNASGANPGRYALVINDGQGILRFTVESFKLYLKIYDEYGQPNDVFSPNSTVRLISKLVSGGSPISGTVYFDVESPNGTITSYPGTALGSGVYSANVTPTAAGLYKITVRATSGGKTETTTGSFNVRDYKLSLKYGRSKDFRFMSDPILPSNSVFPVFVELKSLSNGSLYDAAATCNNLSGVFIQNNSQQAANITAYVSGSRCMANVTTPNQTGNYLLRITSNVSISNTTQSFSADMMLRIQDYVGNLMPLDPVSLSFKPNYAPGDTVLLQINVFQQNSSSGLSASNISSATIIGVRYNGTNASIPSNSYDSANARFNVSLPSDMNAGVYLFSARVTLSSGDNLTIFGPVIVKRLNVVAYPVSSNGAPIMSVSPTDALNIMVSVSSSSAVSGARVCAVSATDITTGYSVSLSTCNTTNTQGQTMLSFPAGTFGVGSYDLELSVLYSGETEPAFTHFDIVNFPVFADPVQPTNYSAMATAYSATDSFYISSVPMNLTSGAPITPFNVSLDVVNYFGTSDSPSPPIPVSATLTPVATDQVCTQIPNPYCSVVSITPTAGSWDPGYYEVRLIANTSQGRQSFGVFVMVQPFSFRIQQPAMPFYGPSEVITVNVTSEKAATLSADIRDLRSWSLINNSLNITSAVPASTTPINVSLPDVSSGEYIIEITATNGSDSATDYLWIMVRSVKFTIIYPTWHMGAKAARDRMPANWNTSGVSVEVWDQANGRYDSWPVGYNLLIASNKSLFVDPNNDGNFSDAYNYTPGSQTNISLGSGNNFTYISETSGKIYFTNTTCLSGACTFTDQFYGQYEKNTTIPIFIRLTYPNGTALEGFNITVAQIRYSPTIAGAMQILNSSQYNVSWQATDANGVGIIYLTINVTGVVIVNFMATNGTITEYMPPWEMVPFESIEYDSRLDLVKANNRSTSPFLTLTFSNASALGIVSDWQNLTGGYIFNESAEGYDLDGNGQLNGVYYLGYGAAYYGNTTYVCISNQSNLSMSMCMEQYYDVPIGSEYYLILFADTSTPVVNLTALDLMWNSTNFSAIFYSIEYLNGTRIDFNISSGNITILNAYTWQTVYSTNITERLGLVSLPSLSSGEYMISLSFVTPDGSTSSVNRFIVVG